MFPASFPIVAFTAAEARVQKYGDFSYHTPRDPFQYGILNEPSRTIGFCFIVNRNGAQTVLTVMTISDVEFFVVPIGTVPTS